ncbi:MULTISPECIES: GNAT family N-acetyltransferase [unclassified Crossiella]|uniref:GNAT family N-acetyltransferase n=1 Tax=unclassified Crossiella TaxID=2620835 RepID=UPI001FFF816F|nr:MULTISPECIES: GNAT family N-acetyltransferase [unclassified Crossiella]MCK2238597.1 GNAT family N-acetyltransferase [Crossiella sp. S99.2]MCK2251833.1 GNAT family N-acetyltransferase [Crossiella sp. S99.1]
MASFLTTERLVLTAPAPADLPDVIALHSDPAVMRYLSAPQTAAETEAGFATRMSRGYPRDLGYWIARRRETGEFLGWFELFPSEADSSVVELGYRLATTAWGQGLASEGSIALVDKAFREHGVRMVTANTMTVNAGSRRVMEKAGLRFVRTFFMDWEGAEIDGSEQGDVEYQLTREEWSASTNPTTQP